MSILRCFVESALEIPTSSKFGVSGRTLLRSASYSTLFYHCAKFDPKSSHEVASLSGRRQATVMICP